KGLCDSSVTHSFQTVRPAAAVSSTVSLHDALPICDRRLAGVELGLGPYQRTCVRSRALGGKHGRAASLARGLQPHSDRARAHCQDRKSTRLNSSHVKISYAVFCLKKKTEQKD